ncbi:MAG: hypothetical protein CMJ58_15905 [Planctomycetaceae bacterium]|nr:hypothetical protein [Planctomycetaceae bacterium]
MSTTEVLPTADIAAGGDEFQYRPLATSAIAALVLGLLSLLIFVAGRNSLSGALAFAPLPLLALWMARRTQTLFRDAPGQYTGGRLSAAGAVLAVVSLVAGVGMSAFVYATEVPEGYERITFPNLRPSDVDERAGRVVPAATASLDGEKVFIKGYMRPHEKYDRVNKFLLVRDNQQCCFGDIGDVKYYDQVRVELPERQFADYSTGVFRVHGTLHVDPDSLRRPGGQTVYSLDADGVR